MTTTKLAIRYFKDKVDAKGYKFLIMKDKTRSKHNLFPDRDTCGGYTYTRTKVMVVYANRMEGILALRLKNAPVWGRTTTELLIKTILHEYSHVLQHTRYNKDELDSLRESYARGVNKLEYSADRFANMHYNRVRKFLYKAGV